MAMADLSGASTGVSGEADALALARCALASGDLDKAEMFAALAPGATLAPYGRLVQAEVRLSRGDPSGAAQLLETVNLPGPAGRRAKMLLGMAQVQMGAHAAGKATLNALMTGEISERGALPEPGGADPAEIRWWLAQGAILRGEPTAARPVLEAIWTLNPTSPRAKEAEDLLRSQGVNLADITQAEGRARAKERAKTYESLRLYPEALALIAPLPRQDSDPATIRRMAKLCFRAKDYTQAVEWFSRIPSPTADERFDHALAMSRTGNYEAAATLYTALYTSDPSTKQGDTASFKVAYLAYDKGDLARAIPLFRTHLQRYPSSAHADEARWFIAWSLYRNGDLDAANAAMTDVLQHHGGSGLAAGARYWQAHIAADKGDAAAARAGYAEVRRRWPNSGYAWFAEWRLGESHARRAVEIAPPAPPALTSSPAWSAGTALAAVGLDDWARAELGPLVATAKSSQAGRVAMAHVLLQAGDYGTARSLVSGSCQSGRGDAPIPAATAACTPRPLDTEAVRRAEALDLPANLPFGIMTAESALKPWVTSPVGARGLMQLMPEVAANIQPSVFGDQPFHPDDLYRPGVNAALGIAELGSLHARFAGRLAGPDLPAVIAGYNGGAEAVERWLSAYPSPPEPDRFAEDIGFTETRRYVRNVLGYMQTYRYLYGD